jgi:polysaccharide pyruvyl transferase WcaK-like protein
LPPSLSISREHNLGRVLESRWNDVDSKLANEKINLKIGIALPAIPHDKIKYAEVVDLLLAVCEKHDCHFIVQAPYDRNLLLKHAGDIVNETNIHHFSGGVETWFRFMDQLDFVVSTRIHGGMAGIINRIPTIIIPTDIRIFELINAMKLPHIDVGDAINKNATSLQALMGAAKKNFTEFEKNRVDSLRYYKRMLESVGLMMNPHLLDVIND